MRLLKFTKKWLSKQEVRELLLLFITWRIWITVFAVLGFALISLKSPHFLGGGAKNYFVNPVFWGWANFDGEHYLSIGTSGHRELLYFYFPLYPKLIAVLSQFTGVFVGVKNFLLSGILISNLSFLPALFVLWRLALLDFKKEVALFSVLALFVFPTSFFFGAVYTEALFLLLVLTSFYFARRGRFFLAGIFGAFASATRLIGILLLPALLVEWLMQREEKKVGALSALGIVIVPFGLLSYMSFLQDKTGDPFIFYQQISHFGQQRAGEFVLLYQVFWRYVKMILTVTKTDPIYLTILLEAAVGAGALLLLVWGYLRKIRPSYLVFAALGYILPTFTGSFSSLPRYILTLFPLFLLLGLFLSERGKLARLVYFLVSATLLAVLTMLFIRGYWVA